MTIRLEDPSWKLYYFLSYILLFILNQHLLDCPGRGRFNSFRFFSTAYTDGSLCEDGETPLVTQWAFGFGMGGRETLVALAFTIPALYTFFRGKWLVTRILGIFMNLGLDFWFIPIFKNWLECHGPNGDPSAWLEPLWCRSPWSSGRPIYDSWFVTYGCFSLILVHWYGFYLWTRKTTRTIRKIQPTSRRFHTALGGEKC